MNISVNSITDWNEVPGSNTYFRTSDVTPYIAGGKLNIFNAQGNGRSWGTPKVTSTVTELTANVVKVEVVGWHKHTVSPVGGTFYFVREATGWVRRTANHKAVKSAIAEHEATQAANRALAEMRTVTTADLRV